VKVSGWPDIIDRIGASWRETTEVLDDWLDDPNNGESLQQHASTSPDGIDEALGVAAATHERGSWARTPINERQLVLNSVADAIDGRVDEIARCDAINSGVPIAVTTLMARELGHRFRATADALDDTRGPRVLGSPARPVYLLRLPLGPAMIMTAWNASTFIAASRVASALAAGCPVVLKPSEWAPWGCQILAEAIVKAGVPSGAFQLVHGGPLQGSQLVADPRIRVLSFTGGQAAGRTIAATAGADFKTVQLELGGNNPAIICGDANLRQAAAAIAAGITKLNGQWCEGPGRIYVQHEMHDELVSLLLVELNKLVIGHSLDFETTFGPIAYRKHRDRLIQQLNMLRDRGGVTHQPFDVPTAGWYLSPTIVTDLPNNEGLDELFGPVVTVYRTASDDESLYLANHPSSGLDAYIFGENIDTCIDIGSQVIAGEVRINGTHLADLGPNSAQTFWDSAGIGGHAPTAEMVELFRGNRVVGVDDPTAEM
jgi:betaine-aldehyde dehydrogenase